VWGLHPETGAVDQLMAMEHLIPTGQKKVAKVYTAACHPLLPHLVAIAANSGQTTQSGAEHQSSHGSCHQACVQAATAHQIPPKWRRGSVSVV
jgi:hypothetical protein